MMCKAPNDAVVTAIDNCFVAYLTASTDTLPGTCTGSYQLHRIHGEVDSCGNTTVATQVVTVVNETPPTLFAYHNFFGQLFHGILLLSRPHPNRITRFFGFDAVDDWLRNDQDI
ncbi:MAG: hypothetical protein R2788_03515 [Saprospiraceae bacterium]